MASDNADILQLNPENPEHYIYQTYIAVDRPDVKHLHFMMKDNPIMTSAMIARAERLYSGIFYRRYILGQWVRAEGIIFGQFANNTQNWIIDELTEEEKNALKFITFGGLLGRQVTPFCCNDHREVPVRFTLGAEA